MTVDKGRQRGASQFVKTPKGTEEKATLKGTTPWFRVIKMNRRVFVSINCMRTSHSSLKGSLSRFNIVPTSECECVDGLQTEE
jgi:hypothetical protein